MTTTARPFVSTNLEPDKESVVALKKGAKVFQVGKPKAEPTTNTDADTKEEEAIDNLIIKETKTVELSAREYLQKVTGYGGIPSTTCDCEDCTHRCVILEKGGYFYNSLSYKWVLKSAPPLSEPTKGDLKKLTAFPRTTRACNYCGLHYRTRLYGWRRTPLCTRCALAPRSCNVCHKSSPEYQWFDYYNCSIECFSKRLVGGQSTQLADRVDLDPTMVLCREAANFYLLSDMAVDNPKLKPILRKKAKYLAEQFSKYMFIAIGGEIRHYNWGDYGYRARELMDGIIDEDRQVVAEYWFRCRSIPHKVERESMWDAWMVTSETLGIDEVSLIRYAAAVFNNGHWSGSVGGGNWGVIANTLLMYRQGETNDVIFVDTAFGLKHNGDLHFNKVWNITGLQHILDANEANKLEQLKPFAYKEVLEYGSV